VAKPTGFLEFSRQGPRRRPVELRLRDWSEVYLPQDTTEVVEQAARCMDCGIPFCHNGCPLGNLIPEWNDLVYQEDFAAALERLHATNNFPEFTGRLCPAPCESACVLGIADLPVSIERTEYEIAERGFAHGWVTPRFAESPHGTRVAIVGSGPAGLAASQQLQRAGYQVTVLERQEKIGGLLRYGIPEFKMEKSVIDRRLTQMLDEGVSFKTGVTVGEHGDVSLEQLRSDFDAVVLAIGSTRPRELPLPGRELDGIMPAMAYLKPANRVLEGERAHEFVSATDRHVVILGGGDTGADCLGTALRQGARSVTQLEIMPQPPETRPENQPWPTMPLLYKVTSAHEEGGVRDYNVATQRFLGTPDGRVRALEIQSANGGDVREIPADLVLIAAGFLGPELEGLSRESLPMTARESLQVNAHWLVDAGSDELGPLFACGDAVRGQSLIVWALAEGRSAAGGVDRYLRGGAARLPEPLVPYAMPWDSPVR